MIDLRKLAEPGSLEETLVEKIDLQRLPRHIAVIMDGNGRWAKSRNLPRVEASLVYTKTGDAWQLTEATISQIESTK